jgi:hypothetical protein
MRRGILISAVVIIVVTVGILLLGEVFSTTGNVISVAEGSFGNQKCVDGDGHMDYRETIYVKSNVTVTTFPGGIVRSEFLDNCATRSRVQEFVCTDRANVRSSNRFCRNGCSDGVCIR